VEAGPWSGAYLSANYSRISTNCSFVSPTGSPSTLTGHLGPPPSRNTGKDNSDIIPPIPSDKRGGSTRVDAQHAVLEDSRAN